MRTTSTRRVVWMKLHPKGQKRLQALLDLREMSHRDLAAAVGWTSHTMVGQLLRGERNSVSPESAVLICKVLQVPLQDLFLTETTTNTRQARVAAA